MVLFFSFLLLVIVTFLGFVVSSSPVGITLECKQIVPFFLPLLDFPLFLGIFQWDEPTKRVPFTAEPEIPEILTKWKAPLMSALW